MKKNTSVGIALLAIAAISVSSCKKSSVAVPESKISVPNTVSTSFTPLSTLSIGLVAYWPGTNSGYDFSGNGYTADRLNSITAVTDHSGNTNGAFGFNGISSFMAVRDNLSLRLYNQDYSMNAWVYLTSYNSHNATVLLGKRGAGLSNGWSWGIEGLTNSNPGYQAFNPGGGFCVGNTAVGTSGWHMVTAVYTITNHTMSMYIDGVLASVPTAIATPSLTTTDSLYIGMENPAVFKSTPVPTDNFSFLNGRLDNICIYNRALGSTDIAALKASTMAPTSGLVAYWPLLNTPNDLSGNGYNGTTTAVTTVFDRFHNNLGAYEFDGTTSSVSVPDAPQLRLGSGSFSLNAWVRLVTYSSTASIIMGKRVVGSPNAGWSWGITNTGHVNYSNGSANSTSTATVGTAVWHMVTVTYDAVNSQRLSIYIDNVLSNSFTGVASANASTTAALYIGRDNPPTGAYFFNGDLNDLRIYNRSLSVTDVNNLYNALN